MVDSRIGIAAKSSLLRRVTGGYDGMLELYLEKYVGRIGQQREERNCRRGDKTEQDRRAFHNANHCIAKSRGESIVIFSDS